MTITINTIPTNEDINNIEKIIGYVERYYARNHGIYPTVELVSKSTFLKYTIVMECIQHSNNLDCNVEYGQNEDHNKPRVGDFIITLFL